MADKPKRRWFQFRLRTLLIAVVLIGSVCAYVAHEGRIVAARNRWLSRHSQFTINAAYPPTLPTAPRSLPLMRRLLGDVPRDFVIAYSTDEEALAKLLFPEAEIFRGY